MPEASRDPVEDAAAFLRDAVGPLPRVLLVLGSGLDAAASPDGAVAVPLGRIPGWPLPTVAGHAGRLEAGRIGGHRVAVLRGRIHRYEGHSPDRVVFPVRVLARLGARLAILTNAAGGLDPAMRPGDLFLIRDHLNLQGVKPASAGGGAPGMAVSPEVYDPALRAAARAAAAELGINLREGVFAAATGPCYETPAEARALRVLGADVAGMSTAPEALALRREGARVAAFSVVANVHGGAGGPVSHAEVLEQGREAAVSLGRLIRGLLDRVPAAG